VKAAERLAIRLVAAGLAASAAACTPPSEPDGAELYASRCAPCHGASGEGDGPLREVLRVDVPSLRKLTIGNGGRFPEARVRAVLTGETIPRPHGDADLPVWGGIFGWGTYAEPDAVRARTSVDALVEHVREIQYR